MKSFRDRTEKAINKLKDSGREIKIYDAKSPSGELQTIYVKDIEKNKIHLFHIKLEKYEVQIINELLEKARLMAKHLIEKGHKIKKFRETKGQTKDFYIIIDYSEKKKHVFNLKTSSYSFFDIKEHED